MFTHTHTFTSSPLMNIQRLIDIWYITVHAHNSLDSTDSPSDYEHLLFRGSSVYTFSSFILSFFYEIYSMYLNFLKSIASTRRCTFPECATATENLRDINRSDRLRALRLKKIYIPNRARVCSNHVEQNTWVVNEDGEILFSQKQVQDLVELISNTEIETEGINLFTKKQIF